MHLHLAAKVYLALVIIALFMNFMMMSWSRTFMTLLFAVIWSLLIEYAGKKGYRSSAWILVILPFAVMYFAKTIAMNRMVAKLAGMMTAQPMPQSTGANSQKQGSKM